MFVASPNAASVAEGAVLLPVAVAPWTTAAEPFVPLRLSRNYLSDANTIARRRVATAGHRIADCGVLEELIHAGRGEACACHQDKGKR